MHLVGFIVKKFVTMQHGHVNVKYVQVRFGGLFTGHNIDAPS